MISFASLDSFGAIFICHLKARKPIGAVVYVQQGFEGTETQYKVSLRITGFEPT